MFIKKLLLFCTAVLILAGCGGGSGWNSEYGATVRSPNQMQHQFYYPEYDIYGGAESVYAQAPQLTEKKNIAVLLPLSGPNAAIGKNISTAIETAFLYRNPKNISIEFIDLSGNNVQKQEIVSAAINTRPDAIIGPLFAEDVQMVRNTKPSSMPVVSFSSDANALGNGVTTIALMPTQSVEEAIKEMVKDGSKRVAILAPNSQTGKLMAGTAVNSANIYDLPVAGLFYYNEGNTDSIKNAAMRASMFTARSAANTRAKEIISDILQKEQISAGESSSLSSQLNRIKKSDTLGKAPFDSVLFLGTVNDSKSLASFLRYYDVGARDVTFYGTVLWDTNELQNDLTMTGAKYATLPSYSEDFKRLYEQASGRIPTRLESFGFDAANLTIGMLQSGNNPYSYLFDPSGYKGLDGLFRIHPNGESERALQVMQLTGSAEPRLTRPAVKNFVTPVYQAQAYKTRSTSEMELTGPGINPMDYIKIPERLQGKYKSKSFGANLVKTDAPTSGQEVIILPEDDSDIFESPDFKPITLEPIDRQLIDSVEISG